MDIVHLLFIYVAVLGVELKASHLLSRCFTTRAIPPPAFFVMVISQDLHDLILGS
jgi:hypothetical protein